MAGGGFLPVAQQLPPPDFADAGGGDFWSVVLAAGLVSETSAGGASVVWLVAQQLAALGGEGDFASGGSLAVGGERAVGDLRGGAAGGDFCGVASLERDGTALAAGETPFGAGCAGGDPGRAVFPGLLAGLFLPGLFLALETVGRK